MRKRQALQPSLLSFFPEICSPRRLSAIEWGDCNAGAQSRLFLDRMRHTRDGGLDVSRGARLRGRSTITLYISSRIDDLTALRRWLKVLVAPEHRSTARSPRPASPKPVAACGSGSRNFPPVMTPADVGAGRRSRNIRRSEPAVRASIEVPASENCADSAASTPPSVFSVSIIYARRGGA